jgi:hypothetical protein
VASKNPKIIIKQFFFSTLVKNGLNMNFNESILPDRWTDLLQKLNYLQFFGILQNKGATWQFLLSIYEIWKVFLFYC